MKACPQKVDQLTQQNEMLQHEVENSAGYTSVGGSRTIKAASSGFLSTATQEEKCMDKRVEDHSAAYEGAYCSK